MPGQAPFHTDEHELLLGYVRQQREVLRLTAHGRTDDQAHQASLPPSPLTVGGLIKHVTFVEGETERLPFADESFDVDVSNEVIDFVPDKDAVFGELHRVLVPGGRIQIADVTIQRPVSDAGRSNIDLWTG